MTRDDIIKLAREAGIPSDELYHPNLERFADLVLAQRKPLSDEEIEQAYRHIYHNVPDGSYRTTYYWIEQGIRYAEQAHGIGEKK